LGDIIASDKEVEVVVELPGVEKKEIKINVQEGSVEISADMVGRKYHRGIHISHDVDVSSAKSTYKNGLLEIVFQRKPASGGMQIKID
jgi:HSP20 family protein